MNVRKVMTICAVLLMAASASQAAYSTISVDGDVSWSVGQVVISPQQSGTQYEWLEGDASTGNYFVEASASATAAEGTEATDSASATRRWWTNVASTDEGNATFTASFDITRDLFTELTGDSAEYQVDMSLKFVKLSGEQVESTSSSIVITDGDVLDDTINVTLPNIVVRTLGGNEGWLYLSVDVYTKAVTAEVPEEPEEPEEPPVTVPAPGAVLLGSLGAGLVGWLRKRKSL